MSTKKESKIQRLIGQHKSGTVLLPKWMETLGISRDLQKVYRKNLWLQSIGTGAYKRTNETVIWEGGLYAIQKQANLPIHAGAMTALSLHGFGHYMKMSRETVHLFSPLTITFPGWFLKYNWTDEIQCHKTSFLPETVGLNDFDFKAFSIIISDPERAILECLYLAPSDFDLQECFRLIEGLSNLRPKLVTALLQKCTSIKVKRLFLYMAEKARHQWFNFLDLRKVDLGTGDRNFFKGGVYNSKYKINIPKELV